MMIGCLVAGLLSGCASKPEVFDVSHAEGGTDDEDIRAAIRFPEYFLMEDFELGEHGRIPATQLIGAGMTSALKLGDVRIRFNDQLSTHGWTTDKMEIGRGYFRVMASLGRETVEIRAVQGAGPTAVFLLYRPQSPEVE